MYGVIKVVMHIDHYACTSYLVLSKGSGESCLSGRSLSPAAALGLIVAELTRSPPGIGITPSSSESSSSSSSTTTCSSLGKRKLGIASSPDGPEPEPGKPASSSDSDSLLDSDAPPNQRVMLRELFGRGAAGPIS
jgi:hypothetical protein